MDVMNTANNMVIQQVCAEKGIDYNQLMFHAQQQHINNIMVGAQQRMIMKEVKRHYQGDTFMGKVRDWFGGNNSADMMNPVMNPMMFPGFIPQQPMMQPAQPMHQQPMQQPMVPPTAPMPTVGEIPFSVPTDTSRIESVEKDVQELKAMLASLTEALAK